MSSNDSYLPNITTNYSRLDCPVFTEQEHYLINQFNVWIEGVTQTCVAIPGFLGNVFFCYILTRKELLSSFNLLLVALSVFDCCYIIGAMLESIRKQEIFDMSTSLHVHLFPYLLYPGSNIAMTASIFMIVAITFERYIAVHNPLDYNQAMNDANAIRGRLLKYLLPVVIASIAFNIPKFLESRVSYDITETDNGVNITTAYVDITWLRRHRHYQTYLNWSQSLVLGFIPVALLIYFNGRIYQDIRERERRKRPKKRDAIPSGAAPRSVSPAIQETNKQPLVPTIELTGIRKTNCDLESRLINNTNELENMTTHNCVSPSGNSESDQNKPYNSNTAETNGDTPHPSNGKNVESKQQNLMSICQNDGLQKSASIVTTNEIGSSKTSLAKIESTHNAGTVGSSKTIPNQVHTKSNNARRRKAEDKMAMIFIAIVTGWLFTNFPRIFLNFQEILNVEHVQACMDAFPMNTPFPPWTLMLDPFSHLFLVINSISNIIFYGMFNKKFREVAKKEINRWLPKTTLRLVQSKSRKTNAGSNANPTSNRVKNDRATTPDMSRTEMTHIPKNSAKGEESIPLTSAEITHQKIETLRENNLTPEPDFRRNQISCTNSNNKLLTDSSTQIPNTIYTTNLKHNSIAEKSNSSLNFETISNGSSIKLMSSISPKVVDKQENQNVECATSESNPDSITKYPIAFKCVDTDGNDSMGFAKKDTSSTNEEQMVQEVIQKRDTPQIYV